MPVVFEGVEFELPILAIDTATLVSSVALAAKGRLLAELTLQTNLTHSEMLMPHIKMIMEMAKLKRRELKAVAVSVGPGSFTGLRIGLATAKSMAYALDIPIVGVPTLAALAYHYPMPGVYIAPMLDAQKGNVYTALYQWDGGALLEVRPPCVESFEDALARCGSMDLRAVVLGEVAVKRAERIESFNPNVLLAMGHTIMPRAANVAMLGDRMLKRGEASDVMRLEPLYIRRSEAEELWERRNGGRNEK